MTPLEPTGDFDGTTVAVIRKSTINEIRVTFHRDKGRVSVDARMWFPGDDGEMHPSKSGVRLDVARLPELAAALNQALELARDQGLISDEQP